MKKLMAGIILFATSITLAWSQSSKPSASNIHWTYVLIITPQTTKHYLDSVTTAWAKDSVVLKFSELKYNSKGKLVKVKGSVDVTSNGHHASGTFAPDKLTAQEIKIKTNGGPGVYLKELK